MDSIAIAFGSRGKGAALAHYEPGRRVINLTKMKGAGSLAHELGHAFDHYLYKLCGLTAGAISGCYLSDNCRIALKDDLPHTKSIIKAMYDLVNIMKYKSDYVKTSYYTSAEALDKNRSKKYYSYIVEMFARAFESYIEDKLHENGMVSQYLVHSTTNGSYKDCSPYPEGQERSAINKAIEVLIQAVKSAMNVEDFSDIDLYTNRDMYEAYKDSVVLVDKKTKQVIDKQKEEKIFKDPKEIQQKLESLNSTMGINDIETGTTIEDRLAFWTDKAQQKGLLGRIGSGKIPKAYKGCVSRAFNKTKEGIIVVDCTAIPEKVLEGAIEGTMMMAVRNLAINKETPSVPLLYKTMTAIVLLKYGYNIDKYLTEPGYLELIKNNSLIKEHIKTAYHKVLLIAN